MKKSISLIAVSCALTHIAMAEECNFTPDESGFNFGFTAYAFPDRSYVVENNTFNEYSLTADSGHLLGASITIDTTSLDTSADPRNWDNSDDWSEATINSRNSNVVRGIFKNFANDGTIKASVQKIDNNSIELEIEMNGVTQDIPMKYTIDNHILHAQGSIDLKNFNTEEIMKRFDLMFGKTWHQSKTWHDVDIYFSVPVEEEGCN